MEYEILEVETQDRGGQMNYSSKTLGLLISLIFWGGGYRFLNISLSVCGPLKLSV